MEPRQLTTAEVYKVLTVIHNKRHADADVQLANVQQAAMMQDYTQTFESVGLDPNAAYDISPEGVVKLMSEPTHMHEVPSNRAARRRKAPAS